MRFDDDGNIWLRQSWIDTAMRCAERGRLQIVKPEWNIGGDAAHLGSGTHSGIETVIEALALGLPFPSKSAIHDAIWETITTKIAEEGIKWNKYSTTQQLFENAVRCYEAWASGILPILRQRNLIEGAITEHKFRVVLFTLPDGRTVGVEGTIDFVPPVNEMWDWKTAGQAFRDREKQRYAIQPTIYTLAGVLGAGHPDVDYSYPMDFTYGVAIRAARKSKPQLLTVNRTQEHADFAIERIKTYVDLALNFTLERPWPRNDDHFLCSEAWCSWWVICKGGHNIDDAIPVQIQLPEAA
jgi:hypothetical protein